MHILSVYKGGIDKQSVPVLRTSYQIKLPVHFPPNLIFIENPLSIGLKMKVAHTNWLNGGTAMSNIAKCVIITLMTSSLVGVVAATDTYVIYPNDGSNTDQTDAIYKELQGIVNGGDIFTSSSHHFGVNYWRTDFTSADADTMKGNQDVSAEEY